MPFNFESVANKTEVAGFIEGINLRRCYDMSSTRSDSRPFEAPCVQSPSSQLYHCSIDGLLS